MRPGIAEVARAAGVSVGTVSNVLNRPWVVSPDTRDRVRRAVVSLGYVPNAAARRLRAGDRRSVALVVDDLAAAGRADVVRGVADRLEANRRQLLLYVGGGVASRFASHVGDLASEGIGGAVLVVSPAILADDGAGLARVLGRLRDRDITTVVTDPTLPDDDAHLSVSSEVAPGLTTTRTDAVDAALALLLQDGHRTVALVGSPETTRLVLRALRPIARAAGLRLSAAASVDFLAGPTVLVDDAGRSAYDVWRTGLSAARRRRVTATVAVGPPVEQGHGAVGTSPYELGRVAVDVLLADADPLTARERVLHLPPTVTRR